MRDAEPRPRVDCLPPLWRSVDVVESISHVGGQACVVLDASSHRTTCRPGTGAPTSRRHPSRRASHHEPPHQAVLLTRRQLRWRAWSASIHGMRTTPSARDSARQRLPAQRPAAVSVSSQDEPTTLARHARHVRPRGRRSAAARRRTTPPRPVPASADRPHRTAIGKPIGPERQASGGTGTSSISRDQAHTATACVFRLSFSDQGRLRRRPRGAAASGRSPRALARTAQANRALGADIVPTIM